MDEWTAYKDKFLEEMLRLEGLRGHDPHCARCSSVTCELIRCVDCSSSMLACADCCVKMHVANPFHVVEVSRVVRTFCRYLGH